MKKKILIILLLVLVFAIIFVTIIYITNRNNIKIEELGKLLESTYNNEL